MGQQEKADTDVPASRTAPSVTCTAPSVSRVSRTAPWLRRIAACALALTLGLGHAWADENAAMHEGGQGADKSGSAFAGAEAFAGDGSARASSGGRASAFSAKTFDVVVERKTPPVKAAASADAKVTVTVDIEEDGIGTDAWTRTVTRTRVSSDFITSVTRSKSYAIDEDGNRAIARAVARARAPNNVAAVRNGAGSVTARTSVDVAGNGVASADAGGSIGIARGGVKVETWGRTSAEVF
jgi:hypothetical protein